MNRWIPAALFLLVSTAALAGGPPWISVTAPLDPLSEGRNAVARVQVNYCGEPHDGPLTAVAEGLVDGKRQTVKLELAPAGSKGAWLVKGTWPKQGDWVLVFSVEQHVVATTLVDLGPGGGLTTAKLHGQDVKVLSPRGYRALDRKATERDLAELLRAPRTS